MGREAKAVVKKPAVKKSVEKKTMTKKSPSKAKPSSDTLFDVNAILDRLLVLFGLFRDVELATTLGIAPQNVGNWRRRGTLDYPLVLSLVLRLKPDVNFRWLLTGEGPQYLATIERGGEAVHVNVDQSVLVERLEDLVGLFRSTVNGGKKGRR